MHVVDLVFGIKIDGQLRVMGSNIYRVCQLLSTMLPFCSLKSLNLQYSLLCISKFISRRALVQEHMTLTGALGD